jgi:hypothetical protein
MSRRRLGLVGFLLIASIFIAQRARAATDTWNNTSGGAFSTASNWSTLVPGSSDTALFNLSNTYNVTFDTNPTNSAFTVSGGNVTWLTNGTAKTYTISGAPTITGGTLTLGTSAAALAVNITNALSINGTGTTTPLLAIGGSNTVTTGFVNLGTDAIAGHAGNLTVSGGSFSQNGASILNVGAAANSAGNLTVSAGTYSTGSGLTSVRARGTININGGTMNQNGDITVDGALNQTTGAFSWAAAHTMTIESSGKVNLTKVFSTPSGAVINVTGSGSQFKQNNGTGFSDLEINNGAQLNVSNGGNVSSDSFFDIGSGTAVFDGAGTSLVVGDGENVLGSAGTGSLTFRNGATGNQSGGGFEIGHSTGSSGALSVQSGAALSCGDLFIATGDTSATGSINVTGATLTQTSDSAFILGDASLGTASLTIGSGGVVTTSNLGATINPTALVTISGGTFNVGVDGLTLNASVTLTAGGTLSVAGATGTSIGSGATLSITESSASLGPLSVNGGAINFNSGSLSYGGNLTVGVGGLFGDNLTLDFSRSLTLTGTTTIGPQHQLLLSGGALSTGSIVNNGTFSFSSGTLSITGASGLTIGTGAALGDTLSATSGQTINVTNLTTVASTGTLVIGDGRLNAMGGLTNNGEVRLSGTAPRLIGGAITNNKLIRGDGRIDNNITNSSTGEIRAESGKTLLLTGSNGANNGKINLQGGTLEFSQALVNAASGTITGNGFLYADNGLANNGQMQLSAGLTSVYGTLTTSSGSKVIVSGGSTSTFYNDVTAMSGSEFRVSTNSTAVFFGNVRGTSFFTGSGTKDFEGPSTNSLGDVDTLGSTMVNSQAVVAANHFNENSLTVGGFVTITPKSAGGGTSNLQSLIVDPGGTLDLNDNSAVITYSGASPAVTIRSYLVSGFNQGNWNGAGIDSSAAHADTTFRTALGYNDTGSSIIVKYTYYGDSNLDGVVNTTDFQMFIDGLVAASGSSWSQGDYTYDGKVDLGNDFDLFLVGYLTNGGALGALAGAIVGDAQLSVSQKAQLMALVPEPGGLMALGLAGVLILRRKHRNG